MVRLRRDGTYRQGTQSPSPRLFSPSRLLLAQGEGVGDHGDELRIRGLALDAGDRVAEELLQGLHVAAVPRDLDRVADFGTFVPKK